jgi:hypothetical protein
MPVADRTTIKAAVQAFVSLLRANLIADPPTASAPFRRIQEGHGAGTEHPRPFMTVRLVGTKLLGATDDDKVIRVAMVLRMVTDVSESDPHDAILDVVGTVDDYLDSIRESGVIEGAEGFDDRTWEFEYPRSTAGARLAAAEAEQSFVVKVKREQNRAPGA